MELKRIAIVGIDGSGKTSCYRELIERLMRVKPRMKLVGIGDDVVVVDEGRLFTPVVRFVRTKRILGKRVKNLQNRTLYKVFKLLELVLRVKIQEQLEKKLAPVTVITDGSPLVNLLAWGGHFHHGMLNRQRCLEVASYLGGRHLPLLSRLVYWGKTPEILLAKFCRATFPTPDIVFFLVVTPELALRRISKRGETKQIHETLGFLTELQKEYELVCRALIPPHQLHIIETSSLKLDQVVDKVMSQIDATS